MHNVQMANPLNSYAKMMKEISKKRVKTEEDLANLARIEFEGGLYWNEALGPVVPGQNVFATIQNGAKLNKLGRSIERGVVITELEVPLIYPGPRTVEELWGGGDSEFVDTRMVVVGTNKVPRTRPIFRQWAFEIEAEVDPEVMDFHDFEMVCQKAGALIGIGDYRKMYGRFDVVVEKL